MITSSKIQFIKENMWFPQESFEVRLDGQMYQIVDVWDDDVFFISEQCRLVRREYYADLNSFVKNHPDESYLDIEGTPYIRSDQICGPGLATELFYQDSSTGEKVLIGYDDYPVVCLENNKKVYFDDCEWWGRDENDTIVQTEIYTANASSLGSVYVEVKINPFDLQEENHDLDDVRNHTRSEAEDIAFRYFREEYGVSNPDVWSVDPDDEVDKKDYRHLDLDDVLWLGVKKEEKMGSKKTNTGLKFFSEKYNINDSFLIYCLSVGLRSVKDEEESEIKEELMDRFSIKDDEIIEKMIEELDELSWEK